MRRRLGGIGVASALLAVQPCTGQEPSPAAAERLSAADVVRLVVAHNRGVENARLRRRSESFDLRVAKHKFVPTVSVGLGAEAGRSTLTGRDTALTRERDRSYTHATGVAVQLPTGTRVGLSWSGDGRSLSSLTGGAGAVRDLARSSGHALGLELEQPLLRGAGLRANRASVRVAELRDASSRLTLRQTLIDTVTLAVITYRDLIRAREETVIARGALERSRQVLQVNQRLTQLGRLAPIELLQSQTEIASREVTLLAAENQLETARVQLLLLLDLDRELFPVPAEDGAGAEPAPEPLDALRLVEQALQERPDYLQAKNDLEAARADLTVAENEARWDLRLRGKYQRQLSDDHLVGPFTADPRSRDHEWTLGVSVSRVINDPARGALVAQARLAVQAQENRLKDLEQEIRLTVSDRVRDVALRRRQVLLASEARTLALRQLEVEEQKLAIGRASTFNVLRFQDDLVAARQQELAAVIEARNAVTLLDQAVGTTLATWGIAADGAL